MSESELCQTLARMDKILTELVARVGAIEGRQRMTDGCWGGSGSLFVRPN